VTGSSRTSAGGAGWGASPGSFLGLLPEPRPKRLSYFNPRTLLVCRNDVLARRLSDPVPQFRARWSDQDGDADRTVDLSRLDRFSFLLMGDTGEGDASQYALVPPLLAQAEGTAFLFLCSDVLYPIGDVNDYAGKYYRPYRGYPGPIYAIPGNHDWYDGLSAFMHHFCGRTDAPPLPTLDEDVAATGQPRWRVRLRRALWRGPADPREDELEVMRGLRGQVGQAQPVRQPGGHFVLDTKHLRLVCLDTGILGDIDAAQGEWLVRVSADTRPKMLLTGRPLVVDGTVKPCPIAGAPSGFGSVLDVVHHAPFGYVASVGGDIHNYQRYPVRVGQRVVQHIVSGGGGAFMHATHLIPKLDPERVLGVSEDEFRAYPLRRDSLAAYSRVLQAMLDRWHLPLRAELTAEETAALLESALGQPPRGPRPVAALGAIPVRRQLIARLLLHVGGKQFHQWFSPFYDWDDPPFFKHFLRIDVDAERVQVTCHAVTGGADTETCPPVEDRVAIPLTLRVDSSGHRGVPAKL
jgi:hypothetical protein